MDWVLDSILSKSKIFESLQAEPPLGRPLGPTCPNDSLKGGDKNYFQFCCWKNHPPGVVDWRSDVWFEPRSEISRSPLLGQTAPGASIFLQSQLLSFEWKKMWQRTAFPNCHFHLGQLQVIDDEGWFWPQVDGGNGMLGNLLMMMIMVTMKMMICWLGNDYGDNADDGDMMTSGLSIQSVIPFFIAKNGRLPICISNDGDKMTVKKAWLMLMMMV